MIVLAIVRASSEALSELQEMARLLAATVYDTRLLLAGGYPAIVLTTLDLARAQELHTQLSKRGHELLMLDKRELISTERMLTLRAFHFEPSALCIDEPQALRLPFDALQVIVKAAFESRASTTVESSRRQFAPGRAVATGGLAMRKTVSTSATTRSIEKRQLCFLFPKDGALPIVLRDEDVDYRGLGAQMATTQQLNFNLFVKLLRERAPQALYDESLLSRKVPEKLCQLAVQSEAKRTVEQSSTLPGVELMAHVIARAAVNTCCR